MLPDLKTISEWQTLIAGILALIAAAIGGCAVYGPVGQGFFLNRLGALERTAVLCEKASEKQKEALTSGTMRLTNADQMGTLFKALCIIHPELPKPEGF